jgi:hypothetical protein
VVLGRLPTSPRMLNPNKGHHEERQTLSDQDASWEPLLEQFRTLRGN